MSVKILGGKARGFPLVTPKSESTRPTSVLVRRKLFDWRQNLEGYIFIDVCAGSGAVGFEALSRGADQVFLNDSMRGSFLTLKQNAGSISKAFQFDEKLLVTNLEARSWVQKELNYRLPDTESAIFFFDPPYEDHKLYFDVLALLKEADFKGEIWVESDRLKGPALKSVTGVFRSIIKTVEQGDHFVVVGKI